MTMSADVEKAIIRSGVSEIGARIPRGVATGEFFSAVVRQAIDEVLNQRSMRYRIDQLDPQEQAYIGTRVEILIRERLDLPAGTRADAMLAGHEADIKWSRRLNWMIGPENLDTLCLGIGTDSAQSTISVGLFVPRKELLGAQNRDKKYTAGAAFRSKYVTWLAEKYPLEQNFIAALPDHVRHEIMSGSSAQERVKRLAQLVPNTAIPRSAIRFVTNNKDDFMRRIREDDSRPDNPLGEMICLSWKFRKKELLALGIKLGRDEFVFVKRRRLEALRGQVR